MNNTSLSFRSFLESPYKSTKRSNYFDIYDVVLSKYIGKKVTVIEIGVLNGGGLFMLRNFLGHEARIIGVDLNPSCKIFEKYGFEIEILNQSNRKSWNEFFTRVGKVDIIIEDGGHTNYQQINSLSSCINNIRDGGIYLCEDTHTSYWPEFGNPSKTSFIEFIKTSIDIINSRGPRIKRVDREEFNNVYSIQFFESVVCLLVDSTKSIPSERITNAGRSLAHRDFRNLDRSFRSKISVFQTSISQREKSLSRSMLYRLANFMLGIIYRIENFSLRKFF